MELIQYPQERNDPYIARSILLLENTAWPQDGEPGSFPSEPDTYLTSFVMMRQDMAVCHVGIRQSILHHRGQTYLAYGLSEVVTHPHFQGQGLATQTIRKAAEYILARQPDLSIFTCARENVPLYTRGGWSAAPGVCFVGGTQEQPFRSDSLRLVTMLRLLSPKAIAHARDFADTDVVFELGENQLW